MKKSDLEKYYKRKQMIDVHRAELDGDLSTSDTVTGSMEESPYIKRRIIVRGRDVVREQWLRQRIYALSKDCARVEAFVAGVEDEHMQALLHWHYLQGLSWPKVRRAMRERKLTADYLRKKANKFLDIGC